MPPKKPVPAKAPVKPVAKAPVKPAGRGGPAGRGAPAGRGGPVKKGPVQQQAGAKKPAPAGKPVEQKPKEKVWTKEDDMARKIQTKYRQYRAKKLLEKKKQEKQEYDDLMDKLEKEAFVKLVKMEQEQAEKQRLKEEAERRRKAEERKRKKRMLEAAFDGDVDAMEQILKEVKEQDDKDGVGDDVIGRNLRSKHIMGVVECEDANENTPLSEAGSGGNIEAIKFLLEKGADPNKIGQFLRTPLYRAAFAGHLEACEVILQNGADPRIYASDGQTPAQIASSPAIVELIENWDLEQTESLLEKLEVEKERRREDERKRKEAEASKLEDKIQIAQQDYNIQQKKLDHAYCEMNKRISEHDQAVVDGFDRPEITLQAIHDAEADVEILKIDLEKARDALANAKLKLREQQKGESMDMEELPGLKVTVRELDDVLFRDVGNRLADSGKWPLIIDPNAQAATFLRYRDTNYINALSPNQMEPEKIRIAVLGSSLLGWLPSCVDPYRVLRGGRCLFMEELCVDSAVYYRVWFGKPCVIDMMEVDMWHAVERRFDEVMEGLLTSMMDKSIMEEEKYIKLIKETDPADYQKNRFNEFRTRNFKVYVVTKNPIPPEELMELCYPIRIHVPVT